MSSPVAELVIYLTFLCLAYTCLWLLVNACLCLCGCVKQCWEDYKECQEPPPEEPPPSNIIHIDV